jgi:hypothetical protein
MPGLLRTGVLDAELAALLWLLTEGGVPLVVTGQSSLAARASLAEAILALTRGRPAVVLDLDAEPTSTDELASLLQGRVSLGLTLVAADLRATMATLGDPAHAGLPEDAIRRLGIVVVVDDRAAGERVVATHYLRPTERDGQGHVQRRPPAVLATWDSETGAFEHFAWGITPELADRVDRTQADLEERQRDRARFLDASIREPGADWPARLAGYLTTEPPRAPAPSRPPATPSPLLRGTTDPHHH